MPRSKQPRVRYCEWCGHSFGKERGPAAKTCSDECQRERNNDKEKRRYARVKNTSEWKEARGSYLARIKERREDDPEFNEAWRQPRREAVDRWREKVEIERVRSGVKKENLTGRQTGEIFRAELERLRADRLTQEEVCEQLRVAPMTLAGHIARGWLRGEIVHVYKKPVRFFEKEDVRKYALLRASGGTKIRNKRAVWTGEMEAELGTTTDVELAAKWGVAMSAVRARRNALGIKAYNPIARGVDWTPEMLAELGRDYDNELGKKWGITGVTVNIKRRALGIPSFQEARRAGKKRGARWTKRMDDMLGTDTDAEIAARLNMSTAVVMRRRKMLGVPAHSPPAARAQREGGARISRALQAKISSAKPLLVEALRSASVDLVDVTDEQVIGFALDYLLNAHRSARAVPEIAE